jgi:hypothetical protein
MSDFRLKIWNSLLIAWVSNCLRPLLCHLVNKLANTARKNIGSGKPIDPDLTP